MTILDYFDEFFPTITDGDQQIQSMHITRKDAYFKFEQYSEDLQRQEEDLPLQEYYELKMKLYFLQGRTMIRTGMREQGRKYIQKLITMAKGLHRNDMLMKGYVEMLCCSLRAGDLDLMAQYIQLAQNIENFKQYSKENGVILRVQGYLSIQRQQYEEAEHHLLSSIEIFKQPKLRNSYASNLAAAYSYLAFSRCLQGEYDESLEFIHRAIDICLEKNIQKSLDVFYEDCGYTLFLKKEYGEAERYFLKSIDLYERYDTFWLRSIADSALAMIYTLRNDRDAALESLRRAEVYSQKEKDHEELEVLHQARKAMRQAHIL